MNRSRLHPHSRSVRILTAVLALGAWGCTATSVLVPRPTDAGADTAADAEAGFAPDVTDAQPGPDVGPDAEAGVGPDGSDTGIVDEFRCTQDGSEIWCNRIDDNCNGMTDENQPDYVSCGVGDCRRSVPTCGTDGRMNTCTPGASAAEQCDGRDNDCNGMTDDGLGSTTCGTGACSRTVDNCVAATPVVCTPGRPGTETCNGLDDDCNGMTDDNLGITSCGSGACRRTVQNCLAGTSQDCIPGDPGPEVCNGTDDDCDGTVDNGLGSSTCGLGQCRRTVQNCVGGTEQVCTPNPAQPETCNGLDDDCDGATDNDLLTATCGIGACQRTVTNCVAGMAQNCNPGSPTVERCNGIDDDCDGVVDNLPSTWSTSCNTGRSGVCAAGTTACIGGATVCVADQGAMPETCNGLDDNCNGLIDEGDPGGGDACIIPGARGICANGTTRCGGLNNATPGRVQCVANTTGRAESCNLLDDDCNGITDDGLGSTSCGVGECARTVPNCVMGRVITCVAGRPADETCNNRDDNCDGQTDNGAGAALCPAGDHVATAVCQSGGTCNWTCDANYYNVNGNWTDGCECQDDAYSATTCASPAIINPALASGTTSVTLTGKIPAANGSDYFSIGYGSDPVSGFPLVGRGRPELALSSASVADNFRFEVLLDCGGAGHVDASCTPGESPRTLTTWDFADSLVSTAAVSDTTPANQSRGLSRAVTWPNRILVRVFRVGGAASCNQYTLTVRHPVVR